MNLIRKILVPVDLGGGHEPALSMATTLARTFGAAIELLHVWQPPPLIPPSAVLLPEPAQLPPTRLEDFARTAAGAQMKQLADQVRRAGVQDVQTRVAVGKVADEIASLALLGHFDLIVMGTHGRTGATRWVLGSVAEKVLRIAPCPVVTVRQPEGGLT